MVDLLSPGAFVVGSNYVASHAGTRMWAEWRADVVDQDFARLEAAGCQIIRVLLGWPEFQPITLHRGGGGAPVEFRFGEEPLPEDPLGQAGLSAETLDHFGELCDLAERHHLAVLPALITGWMSGRMFQPQGLDGLNPLTDPVAIEWELRLVREVVSRFKHKPAIVAWDLGNECNCMGGANRAQAACWTATISNAIRVADPSRPVVSGMHSLSPTGTWRMQDQAEWTDLLCVHPYPVFTPHCDQDPVNTIRTTLHGTAEARMYADIGGKPCLCQEIGTLGPAIASEAIAADFVRTCLYSLWANDCHGLMWWCNTDLTELGHTPYDWHTVERELGLFRESGEAKLVADELTAFRRFLDGLPFERLPERRREAVCILTDAQDHWGVAYSTFVLAKQAGFDLEFQYETQPIKDAPLYLLPSLCGHQMIRRRRWLELLAKVEAGATLYLSLDSGLPSMFEPVTGLEPQTRERRREFGPVTLDGLPGAPVIPAGGQFKLRCRPTRAEVLGREADGTPAFSVASYGKGRVYCLNVPLEMQLTRTPGGFHAPEAAPCWEVYRHLARDVTAARAVGKSHPLLAATEHPLDDRWRLVVVVNHSPEAVTGGFAVRDGWRVAKWLRGRELGAVPANDAVVFTVRALG